MTESYSVRIKVLLSFSGNQVVILIQSERNCTIRLESIKDWYRLFCEQSFCEIL